MGLIVAFMSEKSRRIKGHCKIAKIHSFPTIPFFSAENIPELYETALKYSENSEDYLTQLFMGYVRIKEYKKQQQVLIFNCRYSAFR